MSLLLCALLLVVRAPLAENIGPSETKAVLLERFTRFIEDHDDCFERSLSVGHLTGAAWIVDATGSRVLLTHHRKLNRWLQPGGHADGDNDVLRVALRETSEETGLDPDQIQLLSDEVFDVDIHTIPASRHDTWHEHIDLRFLVQIDNRLPVPGSDESHEVLWVDLRHVSAYNNNRSTWRMVEKTRQLRNALMHGRPVNSKSYWSSRRAQGFV